MKMKIQAVLGVLGVSILAGCGGADAGRSGSTRQSLGSCAMDGTWTTCISDGTNSQTITLVAANGDLTETFDDHAGVTDCSGAGTPSFSFTATYALAGLGSSTRIPGATDVVLTPSVDLGGCGLGNPMYTSVLFSSDCQQYEAANGTPACTEGGAPTTLGGPVFVRQ